MLSKVFIALLLSTASVLAIPHSKLLFTATLHGNVSATRKIQTPSGIRVSLPVLSGNWTAPNGDLIANILPGGGAESGIIDPSGLFHVDLRYTVEFVADKKIAYSQTTGTGVVGVSNNATVWIETDSVEYQYITGRYLYSPGVFHGNDIVFPHYIIV